LGLVAAALAVIVLAGCSSTSTTESTPTGLSAASITAPTGTGTGSSTRTAPTGSATATGASSSPSSFALTSTAFANDAPIPQMYTCQGTAGSPPLAWTGVPTGTTSLDLVVVDPDAPVAGGFTHWVKPSIDPSTTSLPAASAGYTPPCPPSGNHHYIFTLYAFGSAPSGTDRAGIEGAPTPLGKAVLTGTYMKQ
jgi:phosphatidylethanolamine-binding protein (PEBP) family uncharacterized protein